MLARVAPACLWRALLPSLPVIMPYTPPPELAELSLEDIAEQVRLRKLPPVEQWEPENTGSSGMRIATDGTWFHNDSEITRPAMVRAFASLLICDDDGQHWLVMPYQKLSIAVEDAPLIAVDAQLRGDGIAIRLNTDEVLAIGPDHPLTATGDPDQPAIYVHARRGCLARLNRSTYAQIAEIALSQSEGAQGKGAQGEGAEGEGAQGANWQVTSQGETYSLIPPTA